MADVCQPHYFATTADSVRAQHGRGDWRYLFWSLFFLLLIADQIIKYWIRHSFPNERASHVLIPNVLDLTLTYNKGIAFGMFQGSGGLLAPVAIAIAIGAIYYSVRHRKESAWIHIAMALLASGALGNLIDRVFLGQVTDMFHIRTFEFPIFNLADSCITVAAAILIVRWSFEWVLDSRRHPTESWKVPAKAKEGEEGVDLS